MDPEQKNDKAERVRGLGRKAREEIGKGNQMTALRFQTGVGNIRHPRPPFGGPDIISHTNQTNKRTREIHDQKLNIQVCFLVPYFISKLIAEQ